MTTIQPSTSSSPLSASLAFFARRARSLLQDPSLFAAGGVLLLLAWLILYPLFWLFYGSFAYGEQGLGEIVRNCGRCRDYRAPFTIRLS